MRVLTSAGFAIGAAAAITLLAGCSGGSSLGAPLTAGNNNTAGQSVAAHLGSAPSMFHSVIPVAPNSKSRQTKSWMNRPDVPTRLSYISDTLANNITVFGRNGVMQGQIGGLNFPGGLFVDSSRNVWVANSGADNVLVFARGASSPSNTLNDPGAGPNDVTICPNGTVYVSGGNSTSIAVYASGSTSPTGTLTYPGSLQNDALTCDAAGNVFATIIISFHGGVVEFPGGNQSGATQLPISLGGPGGIKPDNAGNLLVDDQSAQTITEYTEAGAPTGNSIHTATDCINFGVTRDSKVVGCPVYVASGTSEGQSYTFPAGTVRQTYSGSFSLPYGFAFDPGQKGT